jgi:hypothetical protein
LRAFRQNFGGHHVIGRHIEHNLIFAGRSMMSLSAASVLFNADHCPG